MGNHIAYTSYALITYTQIAVGFLSANRCLAPKKDKRIFGYSLFVGILLLNAGVFALRFYTDSFTFLNIGALYFIPFYIMNKGPFSHKALVYVTQYYVPLSLFLITSFASEIFFAYETVPYFILMTVITLGWYTVYFFLHVKYARPICERLFSYTKPGLWSAYLSIPFACLFITGYFYFIGDIFWHPRKMEASLLYFTLPLSMLFCYLFLIAAIIGAHDRVLSAREIDLARNVIASGRNYYDKLTEMTEQLYILRHDYKLHLTSMQKLLDNGYSADAEDYLTRLNEKTSDTAVRAYCDNSILNALLDSFAERCNKENISFTVKIILPSAETIDDYELCVIIGNLLENAITAGLRTPEGRQRYIALSMHPHEDHYGIKAENSYDGVLKHEGEELYSTKKDGGMGIISIRSVAKRHNGEYIPVWDEENFRAFVLLKREDKYQAINKYNIRHNSHVVCEPFHETNPTS